MKEMKEKETPMQKQYRQIKAEYPDCILFFHLGDFFEMFYEDARTAAGILDLALTSRSTVNGGRMPMCGIPCHASENYLARLVRAGHRVAVCEQVQDPSEAKGLVRREVTRVVSAATLLEEGDSGTRYLAAVHRGADGCGLAFVDLAEGHIMANQYPDCSGAAETIARLPVTECLCAGENEAAGNILEHPQAGEKALPVTRAPEEFFHPPAAERALCEHFGVATLDGFGLDGRPQAIACAGALLRHLQAMNRQRLPHLDRLSLYSDSDHLYISPAACRGLEMDALVKALDRTLTGPGRRLLARTLYHPLRDRREIEARQEAVSLLAGDRETRDRLGSLLEHLPDLEKALSRIGCGYENPRDLLALSQALGRRARLSEALEGPAARSPLFRVRALPEMERRLESAVNPEMPAADAAGKVIRPGHDAELDRLRSLQDNARGWLSDFQAGERSRTGINSLKVGYNRVFGYYIEVSRANLDAVPPEYQRKQTLVNGERFTVPGLVDFEREMLTARQQVLAREEELVSALRREILAETASLHEFCRDLARVDLLLSFARLAAEEPGYIRPEITERETIRIERGRHPVVEKMTADPFVPNDTLLDCRENRLIILTGPNMAGKSTYIRQVALLVIMAQAGSFVPAGSAEIGLVDRIFTRIGARDEIGRGQSTFMVEMCETAGILNNLTPRSLVILDEVGRGTSTFDGLSLAWAVAEHLHSEGARTLFATHFHELTALEGNLEGARNCNVAVRKWKGEIVFLHRIEPGGTDDSYGIHVARLAGVPGKVVERARRLLENLEAESDIRQKIRGQAASGRPVQPSLFPGEEEPAPDGTPLAREFARLKELEDEISSLAPDEMTPLEALNLVARWQARAREKK